MNRFGSFANVAIVRSVSGVFFACCFVGVTEQINDAGQIQEQSQVMERVLEDALDYADIGDWKGRAMPAFTPFNRPVSSEYVPTVGVMFNVHIAFPISESPMGEENQGEEQEPTDLWEKHIRLRKPVDSGFGATIDLDDIVDQQLKVMRGVTRSSALGGDEISDFTAERVTLDRFDDIPEFSQERVDKLKNAILDAVSKYGHRITGLPEGERLIIIVRAPEAPANSVRIGWVNEPEDATSAKLDKKKFLRIVGPGGRASERLLFSLPKSAIISETTREVLMPHVVEKRY